MGLIHFHTGPVRSGKSRAAVELARSWGERVVYVATYHRDPDDAEMQERVRRHQAERPAWRTLEAPVDLVADLNRLDPQPEGLVLDCLTLWLAARLEQPDEAVLAAWEACLAAFLAAPYPVVIVSNEIGWAPVPESPELRRFRDLCGWANQRTAAAAEVMRLYVAGVPLVLKPVKG